jgi:hypothetical protein
LTMEDDREEAIRRLAHEKWEREGRPEDQHHRHWQEATAEIDGNGPNLPHTSISGEDGHVAPTSGESGINDSGASPPTKGPPAVLPRVVRRPKR